MNRNLPLYLIAVVCLVTLTLSPEYLAKPDTTGTTKKIVFIAGKASHGTGQHEHRAGCMLLADHLSKSGLGFQTSVVTNGWPSDESVFDNADAVVIYADGGARHPAMQHLGKLKELSDAGIGIGCIHYAVEIPKGEPGDVFLETLGGYFETDWSVNPHWDATFKMTDHEIANGVSDFTIRDEWYYHMRFRAEMEGITPILSSLPPVETLSRKDGPHSGNPHVRKAVLEDKKPQHVMWAFERPGKGRSFGFTGGHFHKNWQQDEQRRVVLNAIAWISGAKIPAKGIPSPTPTADEMQANLDR